MIDDLKLYGLMAAVAVVLLMALRLTQVQADNDFLRLANDALRRENMAMSLELEANRAAVLAREAETARLSAENVALTAAINEVYANDPNAKAWADAACPDSVLCVLR